MKHHALRASVVLALLTAAGFGGWSAQSGTQHRAEAASTDIVALFAGCNNVALTWNAGTPMNTVAEGITPRPALEAIWRFFAAENRFRGWSPIPSAPNDYTTLGQRAEPVFICMRDNGQLNRPTI